MCRESFQGAARTYMCPGCRENTEGEYSGLEHEVIPGVVESLKVSLSLKLLRACTFRHAQLWPFPHNGMSVRGPEPSKHP